LFFKGLIMPVVRHALLEEYEIAASMTVEAFRQFEPLMAPGLWPEMEKSVSATAQLRNGGELLVALEEGALLGSVVYCAPGAMKQDRFPEDWAFMRVLAVPPRNRRRGAARALVEACLGLARSDGVETFGLHTNEAMTEARALYEEMGFGLVREIPRIYGFRYWIYSLNLSSG
jgi:ribosomal protein S18 acetylase RimI-like enzyme